MGEEPANGVMATIKSFFEDGGGAALIIPACIVLGVIASIVDCSSKKEREQERARIQRVDDSLEIIRVEKEAQIRQMTAENRLNFYQAFRKKYPFIFGSYEAFDDWLSIADYPAFELLYDMFNAKYNDFDGENGLVELSNYLFWEPPEYPAMCPVCDHEFFVTIDY